MLGRILAIILSSWQGIIDAKRSKIYSLRAIFHKAQFNGLVYNTWVWLRALLLLLLLTLCVVSSLCFYQIQLAKIKRESIIATESSHTRGRRKSLNYMQPALSESVVISHSIAQPKQNSITQKTLTLFTGCVCLRRVLFQEHEVTEIAVRARVLRSEKKMNDTCII